jgi:hypothetical protein
MKAHDFKADAVAKPEMANYFNNLDVLSKASTANLKNFSYLSGILASYLIEQNMIKKKQQDAAKKPSEYVGQVGDKITNLPVTVVFIRGFESSYGFVTLYSFEDDNGNRLTWFSSSEIGLEEKKKYRIEKATVKAHQVSKYGGHKETILLRVKMTDLEGNKINEYTSRISDLV